MNDLELPKRARPRHAAIPIAALAILWLAMLTFGAGAIDRVVLVSLYAGDRPAIAAIARAITFLGEGEVVVLVSLVAAAWLGWQGRARSGLALIAVTIAGRFLVWGQKYGIGRLRPEDQAHLVQVYSPSYPSAHSANSMIVYLAIAVFLAAGTRWRRPAAVFALALTFLVGLSRVVLGVHWPSDVVGGWAFGLLWVLLALPLAERLAR